MAYIILSCRETGLDCDYIIKGETFQWLYLT